MRDVSYGIVPVKRDADSWYVLLIRHRAGHWAFPKGHGEVGETQHETAERELKEETNLSIVRYLDDKAYREAYFFRRGDEVVDKMVEYYLAEVEGEVVLQVEEVSDFVWLPIKDARKRLSFDEARRICDEVQASLNEQRKA